MTWKTQYTQEEAERRRIAADNQEASIWQAGKTAIILGAVILFLTAILLSIGA